MGKNVKRKNLFHRNNLVVSGDLRVDETICVGGNLTVEGDLTVGEIYCMGRLTVHGKIKASLIYTGLGVEAKGEGGLQADSLTVKGGSGLSPNFVEIADYLVSITTKRLDSFEDSVTHFVDEDVLSELEDAVSETHVDSVIVNGDCIVSGPVEIFGNVVVGGMFNPDDCDVWSGSIDAESIFVEGDLFSCNINCKKELEVQGDVNVDGFIDCGQLLAATVSAGDITTSHVNGNIECDALMAKNVTAQGAIICRGTIVCRGYLRAQGCITASGEIKAGKDHGILAGTGVPRSAWLRAGYVCSPIRPRNILTGLYRPLAKRLKSSDDLRPARIRLPKAAI